MSKPVHYLYTSMHMYSMYVLYVFMYKSYLSMQWHRYLSDGVTVWRLFYPLLAFCVLQGEISGPCEGRDCSVCKCQAVKGSRVRNCFPKFVLRSCETSAWFFLTKQLGPKNVFRRYGISWTFPAQFIKSSVIWNNGSVSWTFQTVVSDAYCSTFCNV